MASALQAHKRGRVVGSPTPGHVTIQTILPLGGNTALKITTARLFGPNGKLVGPVTPDVRLDPSDIASAAYGSPNDRELEQVIKLHRAAASSPR